MQWNACSILAHLGELKTYLSSCKCLPEIICLQETWLKDNKQFSLKGYEIVRRDRKTETHGGGVATLIKSGINFSVLEVPDNFECIVVEVKLKTCKYTIVNVYNPPDVDIDVECYKKLFSYRNCIITGDFNAHNTLWGGSQVNCRGEILENLLEEFNYTVINTGL